MTFILCSKKPDEEMAFISFSGNQLSKFGFNAGSRVVVDISKGQIVIKTIDDKYLNFTKNTCLEEKNL